MTRPDDTASADSYLLRMWRERGSTSPWRFSLENVQGGRRRGFGSLEALVAFLQREVGERARPDAPDEAQGLAKGDE